VLLHGLQELHDIGIGFQLVSRFTALIIHAAGAPIVFAVVSWNYLRRFRYTSPLATACVFIGTVGFMDFFVAGLAIQRSLVMFSSLLGTWVTFALIFLVTYASGKLWEAADHKRQAAAIGTFSTSKGFPASS
jgi:hypothetical protein